MKIERLSSLCALRSIKAPFVNRLQKLTEHEGSHQLRGTMNVVQSEYLFPAFGTGKGSDVSG
jgi:hypothetical protein